MDWIQFTSPISVKQMFVHRDHSARAQRTIFLFGCNRGAVAACEHSIAFIAGSNEADVDAAAGHPFLAQSLEDGRNHVAIDFDAGNEPAAKSVSCSHTVFVDLVLRILRRVVGAYAVDGRRSVHRLFVHASYYARHRNGWGLPVGVSAVR